ncbi:hypothetical protein [Vulcanisaeta distributa]|uniref:hypothetical protein n=1 Tax=Vulcanisaeta distributa TaxID=164451 RepID=UPI0006D0D5F1|nr:hypothetical protein [Vulcanisaeta distributa]
MNKHYIVGKGGKCPKCGMEGTVILRVSGSRPYVYVRHGRVWHYIGTLDRVNLESIMNRESRPVTINQHPPNTLYLKAMIIAMLATVVVMVVMGMFTKYLTPNNNVNVNTEGVGNTAMVNYGDFDINDGFINVSYGETNICPLTNDID